MSSKVRCFRFEKASLEMLLMGFPDRYREVRLLVFGFVKFRAEK